MYRTSRHVRAYARKGNAELLNRLTGQRTDLVAEAGIANDRYSDRARRGAA
jgi:hypothetical protein